MFKNIFNKNKLYTCCIQLDLPPANTYRMIDVLTNKIDYLLKMDVLSEIHSVSVVVLYFYNENNVPTLTYNVAISSRNSDISKLKPLLEISEFHEISLKDSKLLLLDKETHLSSITYAQISNAEFNSKTSNKCTSISNTNAFYLDCLNIPLKRGTCFAISSTISASKRINPITEETYNISHGISVLGEKQACDHIISELEENIRKSILLDRTTILVENSTDLTIESDKDVIDIIVKTQSSNNKNIINNKTIGEFKLESPLELLTLNKQYEVKESSPLFSFKNEIGIKTSISAKSYPCYSYNYNLLGLVSTEDEATNLSKTLLHVSEDKTLWAIVEEKDLPLYDCTGFEIIDATEMADLFEPYNQITINDDKQADLIHLLARTLSLLSFTPDFDKVNHISTGAQYGYINSFWYTALSEHLSANKTNVTTSGFISFLKSFILEQSAKYGGNYAKMDSLVSNLIENIEKLSSKLATKRTTLDTNKNIIWVVPSKFSNDAIAKTILFNNITNCLCNREKQRNSYAFGQLLIPNFNTIKEVPTYILELNLRRSRMRYVQIAVVLNASKYVSSNCTRKLIALAENCGTVLCANSALSSITKPESSYPQNDEFNILKQRYNFKQDFSTNKMEEDFLLQMQLGQHGAQFVKIIN